MLALSLTQPLTRLLLHSAYAPLDHSLAALRRGGCYLLVRNVCVPFLHADTRCDASLRRPCCMQVSLKEFADALAGQ